MAFQTGSKVNPRLGALDYSGYTNAAAIKGKAMQELGSQIQNSIIQYAQEKKKKAEIDETKQLLVGQGLPEEDANLIAKRPGIAPSVLQYANMRTNQKALDSAIWASTDEQGDVDWKSVPKIASDFGATNTQEIMQFAELGRQQDYAQSLIKADKLNKKALNSTLNVSTDSKGNLDLSLAEAIDMFRDFGGTDIEMARKTFKGLSTGQITAQEIEGTDYVGVKKDGELTQVLPKTKPEKEEKTKPTAFEQNLFARKKAIDEVYKLMSEGNDEQANAILFSLGERNPEGMPLTVNDLRGNSASLSIGGQRATPEKDSLGLF